MSKNEQLTRFGRAVRSLQFMGEGQQREDAEAKRDHILGLFSDKIIQELKASRPLIAVVAGGTNVGKSTLVNGLIGKAVTTVSVLARGTKTPVICGSDQTISWLENHGFLDRVQLYRQDGPAGCDVPETSGSYVIATEPFPPHQLLVIDSPDMDSEYDANRVWATRLMDTADIVILVTTPEKYHDEVVCRFLERCVFLGRSLCAVFNKSIEDDAYDDFVSSVWQPATGTQPVFRIDWISERSQSYLYDEIRKFVVSLESKTNDIKRQALKGSVKTLREETFELLQIFEMEQQWLSDLHAHMDASLDTVCKTYRNDIAGEKFEELDRVFGRLLFELKIPILDDFYGGIRSVGKTVWHHVGRLSGLSGGASERERARNAREVDRVIDSSVSLRIDLEDTLQRTPRGMNSHAKEWLRILPLPLKRQEIDPFLLLLNEHIESWIRDETQEISRRLAGKPGLRKFIIAMKATLQVGSGVVGAVLTGGLEPADLAVAPVVERMSAYLIERGIGYSYFRRSRVRLLDARTRCLRDFLLKRYLQPLQDTIPDPDERLSDDIKSQLDTVSLIADEVNHA